MNNLEKVKTMVYAHLDFLKRNQGLTKDGKNDHFILNPDFVLSNNRHFIAETMAEYQPNGDGTTEGQSLYIIGQALMYMATQDQKFLEQAEKSWQAYIQYFYAGQAIPNTPQRYIANWLVNAKEPVLAHYPIHPKQPTQGGYKSVPLVFKDGQARIPHGAPFWGEYLDVATFAHRGHMSWDAINGSVQTIKESINWQTVYDKYRNQKTVPEPWSSQAWINWSDYIGQYNVEWNGSEAQKYPVSWINVHTKNKVGMGKGPNDQLWSGDIIERNIAQQDIGVIQLEDKSINGVYLFNYAVKLPVAQGGYMFSRNEVWHNRPVHTPLLGSKNQLGNAADAEVWFVDACYLLWRITANEKYKKALGACFFTAHEYTYIDSADKFFRQSKSANTPFTDATSYGFSYPEKSIITYGRDTEGYIDIGSAQASQHFLEQKAIWYRIKKDSKLRVTAGGVDQNGNAISFKAMLEINATKEKNNQSNWWGISLPATKLPSIQDIPLNQLTLMTNPNTKEDYLVADSRAISSYGGCTWQENFEKSVYDNRSANIIRATYPNDSSGLIIGFWLTQQKKVTPKSIVYRADAGFNVRITDQNGWNWYWLLPQTSSWSTAMLDPKTATLSGYQPNHNSTEARPKELTSTPQAQILVIQDGNVQNAHFDYYVINDIPPLFSPQDGWTLTFRLAMKGKDVWKAKVGDCKILDYRLDSLAYCPGVIPFSNIYSEGTDQTNSWHGMPYPGYQYPMMYTIHKNANKYNQWLNNQVNFLYDSQMAYQKKVGILGPGCAGYVWNRWDNVSFGQPDTWTNKHWGDGKPWSGYQPRAFNAAARAWYELTVRGKAVPPKLKLYVENWIKYLTTFANQTGHTPNDFPIAEKPSWIKGEINAHMVGLWLAGCCYAKLAGCKLDGLNKVNDTAIQELQDNFVTLPNKNISGCWSPAPRSDSDNGMYFGFYTGEIYRGLALYLLSESTNTNIYAKTKIPNHLQASLD